LVKQNSSRITVGERQTATKNVGASPTLSIEDGNKQAIWFMPAIAYISTFQYDATPPRVAADLRTLKEAIYCYS